MAYGLIDAGGGFSNLPSEYWLKRGLRILVNPQARGLEEAASGNRLTKGAALSSVVTKSGPALSFDGTTNSISTLPHSAQYNVTGAITIVAWGVFSTLATEQALLVKRLAGNGNVNIPFYFAIATTGRPVIGRSGASFQSYYGPGSGSISLGVPQVVVVRVPGGMRSDMANSAFWIGQQKYAGTDLYSDGSEAAVGSNSEVVSLGLWDQGGTSNPPTWGMNGIAVFAESLSDAEISAIIFDPRVLYAPLNDEVFATIAAGGGAAALEGSLAASGTVSGALTTAIRAAASVSGSASIAAALTTGIPLAASLSGSASVSAALSTAIRLNGSLSGTASVSGDITGAAALASTVSASAIVTGALTTAIRINASLAGAATVAGTLTDVAAANFTASLTATATATASLTGGSSSIWTPASASSGTWTPASAAVGTWVAQ